MSDPVREPAARAPLRIAFATDWYLPRRGGIELHLADLGARLAGRGHRVSVLTSTPRATAGDGVTLAPLGVARIPFAHVAASPRLLRVLERELTRGAFDVVHAHVSVVSPVAFGAALVAQRLGMPLVVTFHSMLHAGQLALRAADRVLAWRDWRMVPTAVSATVAAQVEGSVARGASEFEVRVLPNGIDLEPWRAAPDAVATSKAERPFVVATAMRLQRKKRPSALLRAFAAAQAMTARPMGLVVIGDGPERAALERAARRLGLADSVRFEGWRPREEIARRYAAASVFASASRHESFGIAALEARAAGLPVVAMRRSGSTEFLAHEVSALLADDDTELARHLARLANDEPLRHRLAAHRGDVDRFAWPAVVAAHEAAYADAIAIAR